MEPESPPAAPIQTDDELVACVRAAGRGPAGELCFRGLVDRHKAWLVRYILYLLHDADEAEDVAQEVFVTAFMKLDQYRGDGFKAWVRQIATRRAFNRRRDAGTRKQYEHGVELDQVFAGPEDQLGARQAILSVLAALPYPTREILILRHVEELEMSEIATLLDIGVSAAKMRLKRAREDFKTQYGKQVTRV